MTCTYSQSIESKSRQDDIVRDIVLALAIVVIFGPFALLGFVA